MITDIEDEQPPMNLFPIVKWAHVVSSALLVGTGFGSAYYLFFANRSADIAAQAVVSRLAVRADRVFTVPAIVIQPLTGFAMAIKGGYPLMTPWLLWSICLYLFAGACWLPVLWLQQKMAALAQCAATGGTALPPQYARYARIWTALGVPAFAAMLVVFYLMVARPGQ